MVPDHDGEGSRMSKTTYFPKLKFYIKLKGAKNLHVLEVLDWGFGGLWRFLTGVFIPDHDGDGSAMSQTSYVPKFSFLH